MKKILSILLLLAILLGTYIKANAENSSFFLGITIDFEENWLFSTYDVEMYINLTPVATLPHGQNYEGLFRVEAGDNTVWFYKQKDHSVYGQIDFTLKEDTSITCGLHCHSDNVRVDEIEIKAQDTETNYAEAGIPVITKEEPAVEKKPSGDHYDESLSGRGSGYRAGEPNYVGVIGYVVVFGDQGYEIEKSGDIENTSLWDVSTYEPDKQFWNEVGKLPHKTEVVVREQLIHHRSYGNYSGYLYVQKTDDGSMHYIDVKNF